MAKFVDFDPEQYGIKEKVCFSVLREMLDRRVPADGWEEAIKERREDLIPKHITKDDILAIHQLPVLPWCSGAGTKDDIDHLGNRRLRCVGELLQNQFRVGFTRLERVIRERMTIQDLDVVTPQSLINIRPVTAVDQGVLRFLPAVAVHGPEQPSGRADAQAPSVRTRSRRPVAVSAHRFDVRDVHYTPLRPYVPDRDAGRSEHRPDQLPGDLCADQRIRLHRSAVPQGRQDETGNASRTRSST